MTHALSITLEPPLRNKRVVAVAGELDVATCGELEAFLEGLSGSVVLDCDALTFIDVASMRALERAAERLGRLSLVNIKPHVARVVRLTGRCFLLDCPGSCDVVGTDPSAGMGALHRLNPTAWPS